MLPRPECARLSGPKGEFRVIRVGHQLKSGASGDHDDSLTAICMDG